MIDPALGPYLFDTSAHSWLRKSADPAVRLWFAKYLEQHALCVSAITVMERIRGYAQLLEQATLEQQEQVTTWREDFLSALGHVFPVDASVALYAGELAAMLPLPPTPLKRSHRLAESRQDRLFRWRCDILIAATALTAELPLMHNNPADFETIRATIEVAPRRFPGLGPLNLVLAQRLV